MIDDPSPREMRAKAPSHSKIVDSGEAPSVTLSGDQPDNLYDGATMLLRSWVACFESPPRDWQQIAANLLTDTQALLRDEAAREESFFTAPNSVAKGGESEEPYCWHCGVVLACKPILRCEDCPEECDIENCDEIGCQDQEEGVK